MDDKKFWRINLKVPKVTAIFMIFFVIFSMAVFYFQEWPRPLILNDPPFPEGSIMNYEETSMRTWYSGNTPSSSDEHVWRKEYTIGLGNCCESLNSPDKIFAFMDEWMNSQGWVRWDEVGSPCGSMAEAEFLERNSEYVPYVPSGTKRLSSSPAVCIAVWPWKDDIYAVLVVTSKE